MKKLLIGTTALVAAGTIAGSVQAASKIKMGVGGYFMAFLVGGDQDDGPGQPGFGKRGYDVEREAEIIFNGKTKLDNGITVGVQVQLEAETCGDQIDETFIYFSGGFGRLVIGSENSATYLMHYASPPPSHWAHGLNSPDFRHVSPGTNSTAAFPSTRNFLGASGDPEKITYFTPRFAGFQVGASYTPDASEETSAYGGFTTDVTPGQHSDIIEVAVNYVRKFGAVNVALSAGYGRGFLEAGSGAVTDDRNEWAVGGRISFAGFTIGAAYRNDDNGIGADNGEDHHANIGIRYARGAWGVGIQYAHITNEGATVGSGGNKDEYNAIEVGGSYNLGPGVILNGGVQWHDLDDHAATVSGDNEAIIFFIGTALLF